MRWHSATLLACALLSCGDAPDSRLAIVLGAPAGGDETWYLVSAHLANQLADPLWETLSADEKLYGVLVNGEVSVVLPGVAIGDQHSLLAATRELAQAEAFASQWDAPVDRVITSEMASQPTYSVSLVQLIAAPERWAGKRVEVQGFLGSLQTTLFLSREHAEALDVASGASLQYVSQEAVEAAAPVQIIGSRSLESSTAIAAAGPR